MRRFAKFVAVASMLAACADVAHADAMEADRPQSDYDRRQVLMAYVKKFGIEPSVRDSFFSAVDSMRSDYDRAETLLVTLSHSTVDPATRPAFVASAERLKSSYDQNRVLAALVKSERR